eukprot:TRINITY_DN19812_c0_g1_i11.p2 TRINITY_DN19812_c0_g1~~TRINITY_DN19812_c0_g1_i11.p2  ORF type:complete len:188 (-),score=-32.57 TRINITY_DN19812_c0_g1_i11:18-581(-)
MSSKLKRRQLKQIAYHPVYYFASTIQKNITNCFIQFQKSIHKIQLQLNIVQLLDIQEVYITNTLCLRIQAGRMCLYHPQKKNNNYITEHQLKEKIILKKCQLLYYAYIQLSSFAPYTNTLPISQYCRSYQEACSHRAIKLQQFHQTRKLGVTQYLYFWIIILIFTRILQIRIILVLSTYFNSHKNET